MRLPEPDERFIERYEILDVLGRGGFACVYRARDLQVGRDVALKVLAPDAGDYSLLSSARFVREAHMIAALQSPHSITLFDFGQAPDGLFWMAFEFVDASADLHAHLALRGAFETHVVVHILHQVLSALAEAHARGVVHRDIKPANILVHEYAGDPWRVKLLDFGLAKPVNVDATQLTAKGRVAGTPRYMSPEQVFGIELGPQGDIYSLGLVIHELLTGTPAIGGDTMKELLRKQVGGEPIRLPADVGTAALRRIVDRMCMRPLDKRYESVVEIQRDLRAMRAELNSMAPTGIWNDPGERTAPRPVPTEQTSSAPSAPTWVVVVVGVTIAVVVFIVVAVLRPTSDVGETSDAEALRAVLPPSMLVVAEPEPSPNKPSSHQASVPARPSGDGGCGVPVRRVGETELVVDLGGFERRTHRVYIPRDYDPAAKHPLFVVFRDIPDTQRIIQRFGLDELADEKSVVILVPEDGALSPWMTDSAMHRAVVGIEDVTEELCVDRSRIFGFGHGAGGRAVEKLPCYFDRMTATATSSFRPHPDEEKTCDPPTPVPHLHIATLKDRARLPGGGRGCGNQDAIPVAEQDRRRRAIGRCGSDKTLWEQHKHGSCWTWDCDVDYVTCHVDGGREWPGVRRVDHAFVPTQCDGEPVDFPFRDTIWRFFEEASK